MIIENLNVFQEHFEREASCLGGSAGIDRRFSGLDDVFDFIDIEVVALD